MLDVLVICPVYNHEKYIRSCLDGIVPLSSRSTPKNILT